MVKKAAEATATVVKKPGATKKPTRKGQPPAGLSLVEGQGSEPVLLEKGKPASMEAVSRALTTYGVAFSATESLADLVGKVRAYLDPQLLKLPEDDVIMCQSCGEAATEETEFCPFCGDEGLDAEGTEAPVAAASSPKSEPATTATTSPVTAVVPSTPDTLVAKQGELENIVVKIKDLFRDLSRNSYDIGLHIRDVAQRELWKAKGYSSFKEFVEVELGMSRTMAYRLAETTEKFDRATFERVGSTKLSLVASIQDADERAEALEAAKAGATTKEIARAKENKKSTPGAGAKAEKVAPPKKTGDITLLTKVDGKPQTHNWRNAATGRPLKAHKDDAYVEVNLSDDVRMRIALVKDASGEITGVTTALVRVEE